MSFFFSHAGPRQAAACDGPRKGTAASLQSLLQTMSGKDLAGNEVDTLQTLIESLSLPGSDLSQATNHLHKAKRYLRSNEVGAALYELRLLLDCLQCC